MYLLRPKTDKIYQSICVHCLSGSMLFQRCLLLIQVLLAFSFTVGYRAQMSAFLSWFLYLSLTLRNTWLSFILDRYYHHLLFYASFLPTGCDFLLFSKTQEKGPENNSSSKSSSTTICNIATIALKLQVFWIYLDAGSGKYMDPLQGWTYSASPLPALDTYTRHTVGARYVYALLGPYGLRLLTPTVVYVELLACPIVLLGSFLQNWKVVYLSIGIICSLHIGIAFTLRNTVLLSLVACAAWMIFLPPPSEGITDNVIEKRHTRKESIGKVAFHQLVIILCFITGSIWFETIGDECNQSMEHIWSTLLHNRWNVFVGAEE